MDLTLVITVVVVALVFEYINGFHDTANSIATVVATKVLSPGQAVFLAAGMNLIGALMGTAVAKTIASGLVDTGVVNITALVLICALSGGVIWNLITWWWGLPSSSSHALVGGLCGAALAAAGDKWNAIIWNVPGGDHWWQGKGLVPKVIIPMIVSPLAGFILGIVIMGLLFALFNFLADRKGFLQKIGRPRFANAFFAKLQIVSAGAMGWAHGSNDAQKTMGIIALALVSAGAAGQLDNLPAWLSFLKIDGDPKKLEIPLWIKVTCAIVMAAGTAAGGWRIIKTLGHKMVKLHPVHGFAAETASATMILSASSLGIPVSTTHNISAAIMGVGSAKRLNAIKWTVVERMVWAWILTIPIAALLGYGLVRLARIAGLPV
ncbi:inorganic phosphate transporter [Tahibacter amnicola]|uniref:Phosphate transporter n=1 Tax=Tahibacter amnicola TaxID=2976241 RepID=A0ABY6BB19_9GAMM|nr:inorganic phosphate transporter [Tahibacter amnicola]UXI67251.1 inorganic phosphate transporter [Tahibacter amnicola]